MSLRNDREQAALWILGFASGLMLYFLCSPNACAHNSWSFAQAAMKVILLNIFNVSIND